MGSPTIQHLKDLAVKEAREEERKKFSSLHKKIIDKIDTAIVVTDGKLAFLSVDG